MQNSPHCSFNTSHAQKYVLLGSSGGKVCQSTLESKRSKVAPIKQNHQITLAGGVAELLSLH
jgi:hypothetical protein